MGHPAKITSKGQLTLPVEIREQMGVGPGDHVEFYVGLRGEIRVRKRNLPASAFLKSLTPRRPLANIKCDDDAIAGTAIARDARSHRRTSKQR